MRKFIFVWLLIPLVMAAQDATEIVRKSYDKMQGNNNEATMRMTIVRPTWSRTISIKTWSKGKDYSLAVITDPAKEKGQAFLKRKNEIWNWVPSIGRIVKLPPSMLSQGWMGSDFSNDDLLKEVSITDDYTHQLLGIEKVNESDCYKIKLTPKENTAVVWGSMTKWISKDDYFQLKTCYFDEETVLIKTETASEIKMMDDRRVPTHFEISITDKPGYKTIMELSNMKFNIDIAESFFSQQNMKSKK